MFPKVMAKEVSSPKSNNDLSALLKELNVKQLLFANEYMRNGFNATQAAIKAGYSEKTAAAIGFENLRKPKIRNYIRLRLSEMVMTPEESLKGLSDIAKGNLKKYMVVRTVRHTPQISISLAEYIERRKDKLERIQYVHDIAKGKGLLGKDKQLERKQAQHEKLVNEILYDLIELETRLTYEPNATVIVDGPEELIETADIDLAALAKDKEAGSIIKSIAHTQFGIKVEMYPADAALINIGKHHGLFKEKVEHSGPNGEPIQTKTEHSVIFKGYDT